MGFGTDALLAAAFAMVVETACSSAPAPQAQAESSGQVVTKIHTIDGTLYVTNHYTVTDSTVVIEEVLRGKQYYPDSDEPHLYNHPDTGKEPPADIKTPIVIPVKQVDRIEPWRQPHKTYDRLLIGVALVVGVVIAVMALYVGVLPEGGD